MLRILDITAPDISNGNGIRVTLWVAGCTHHCKGCHNPWTWNFEQGIPFIENQDEILNKLSDWLSRDYVEGLTLSGGDPLCQDRQGLEELMMIIKWVRRNYPKKNIWLYTGYIYENIDGTREDICNMVDVVVDGPYIEEKRDVAHTPFRGSTNQRILKISELKNEKIK